MTDGTAFSEIKIFKKHFTRVTIHCCVLYVFYGNCILGCISVDEVVKNCKCSGHNLNNHSLLQDVLANVTNVLINILKKLVRHT